LHQRLTSSINIKVALGAKGRIMKQRVWLITGVSSGFGQVLASHAASAGDIVVGTVRKQADAEAFTKLLPSNLHAEILDVTHTADIPPLVQRVVKRFGRIDVLVNNAGYGLIGAIEEVSEAEAQAQMATNFFGPLALTRAVLPVMREQGNGHIIQFSSVAGIHANPGGGLYHASKFALEGFSEALQQEVAPLGIKVTIVEPGPFKTDFFGRSIHVAASEIPAYAETAGATRRRFSSSAMPMPMGDPVKGAKCVYDIVGREDAPLRLPLGERAVLMIRKKAAMLNATVDQFEQLAKSTDVTS
jgi:NAD(P)-dependent dehydrogenase (short-subunit alcohol dehydrogenase family)